MDEQVNPLERDHSLSVILPGGLEKKATVHGSKPVMDLLVILCANYHLNPSDYTVEVLSPNKNNISFKPNSPIGSLEAETIVLKPKGMEEKIRRPYMPEPSVRLLINYNKSHKAVVRVNPSVPLEMLLPVVCDKCEFKVETTILLRDPQSKELLDLTKTLNEHGLREVFAKDTAAQESIDHQQQPKTPEAAVTPTEVISPPPLQGLSKKKTQKENRGFLSLFRRSKKKPEMEGAASAPVSPGLKKQMRVGMNSQGVSSSNTLPADMPKKRRAPQPPMGASQSFPNHLGTCHLRGPQGSSEMRSTKRRAPPPPRANTLQTDTEVKGTVDSLNTVEELRESDESDSVILSLSSSSSPHPSHPRSSSSSRPSFAYLHEVADPYLPSFRGKDLSDARCALARVLTSSVSKGTLAKHLKNSATFPKFYKGSSFMSMTPVCSDNGVFCVELETPKLPSEPEWEDPVQRKRMTTFKIVPSKKQKSHDPELPLDVSDQITVEDNPESGASPEVGKNLTEAEEDPCSPDRSETETPLQSPKPSPPPSLDLDSRDGPASPPPSLDLDSRDGPASPPPPLDLDSRDGPASPPPPLDLDSRDGPASPPPSLDLDSRDGPASPPPPLDLDSRDGPASPPPPLDLDSRDGPASPPPPLDLDSRDGPASPPPPLDLDSRDGPASPPPPLDLDSRDGPASPPPPLDLDSRDGPASPPPPLDLDSRDGPASPPPPMDLDNQDCPGSPLSEGVEKQKEEEEPEATSEVILTAPSYCSDGELPSDGQINSEDRSECRQSPGGQSVRTDTDHCSSYTADKEVEEEWVQEEVEDGFPPPPSPVFFNEDIEVLEEGRKDTTASSQPQSPTSNGQTIVFSEDHQNDQSAAGQKPLDKMCAAPSRFAQAVALAVQRSHLQRHGKGLGPQAPSGPHSTLPSPPRSTYQYGA
ncbi:actin cytoskeleton-regulatory complex protein PAN1-like [Micropterus salmoides]|uniref:actin cytoskeleton-regulatory complex protein PAN1-like n=1 Tax=Micropterus salmoides TaxID=27706 RepID=UPI0018ECEC8B|nr:actin cytoskeleton-regulatory complex protein PAN1-like [Micropterus salmoides]